MMRENLPTVVKILEGNKRCGSGFLAGQGGVVITAFHVIGNRMTGIMGHNLKVEIPESKVSLKANVWLGDPELDIAILQVEDQQIQTLGIYQLRDRIPTKGERVEIIGYPIVGRGKKLVLSGRVSGSPSLQQFDVVDPVQSQQLTIDEKINYKGMSGGPVLINNVVIGVFRWQLLDADEDQPTGVAFCTLISDILTKSPSLRSRLAMSIDTDPLATKVLGLLKMLGYQVSTDVEHNGVKVPVLAILHTPLETRELVVGFHKDHLIALIACANRGAQNVIFIATEDPPNEIDKLPGISVKRYQDISRSLIDFFGYIDRVIYDYEHYDSYVAKNGELIRIPIIDMLVRCNLYKYFVADHLSCRLILKDGPGERQSLVEFVQKWLDEPGRNHLSILGDYGVGKSSFCLYLTYLLALRYREDPVHNRVPLFIPLKDYPKTSDWKKFVLELLRDHYDIRIENYSVFQKFLESGQVVLILDGFDEMINKTNRSQTIRSFEEFAKFVVPGSKVILTCRTHYFIDQRHVDATLGQYETNELLSMVRQRPNFELIELKEFTDEQIVEVLQKYRPEDWEFAWVTIRRIYNLRDLARRAVLLDMIVKTLPSLEGKTTVHTVDIYKAYTELWIEHEDWRSFMTTSGKRLLMENLAMLMWEAGGDQNINYRDLRVPLETYFRDQPNIKSDIDHFEHDTRTCTFLLRDRNGNYRFAHKSFYEFFVASGLAKEINAVQPTHLKTRLPSPEIIAFLLQLITNVDKLISLIYLTRERPFEEMGFIGGTAATLAAAIDPTSLRGKNLYRTCLQGADFTGADLTDTNLKGADLRNALLSDVSLNSTDLRESNLEGAQFIEITSVRTVAFSADSQWLVSAGVGGTLVFWEVVTGKKSAVLRGHAATILSVEWSPDDNILASSSEDGVINIWRPESQELITSLKGHDGPVYSVSWSAKGDLLASSGDDGKILIWQVENWEIVKSLAAHDNGVLSIDWHPPGEYLLSSGIDRTVRVWSTTSWDLLATLSRHKDYVRSVKWRPDGSIFASSSDDGTINLWSMKNWEFVTSLECNSIPILSIDWHPRGEVLAGGLRDDSIKFWKFPEGQEIKSVKEHVGRVWDIAWSPDRQILASAGNEGCAKIWYAPAITSDDDELRVPQNFGTCLKTLETRFSCAGARIGHAKGINTKGYQIVRNKDRPWEIRDGTLEEWLRARGALSSD